MWDFTPWSKRNSEPEPRIHEELTEPARIRLANILTQQIGAGQVTDAYSNLLDYTGQEVAEFDFRSSNVTVRSLETFIRETDDMDLLWDFLEYLLNRTWSNKRFQRNNDILLMAHKIERTLVEEGILVQMKPSTEEMAEWTVLSPANNEYRPC